MRALLQKVSRASVRLPGGETRSIGQGLLVYLGVGKEDTEETAKKLSEKVVNLRIFPDADNKFDRSLMDVKGSALVISQFTLFANAKGGRRPDFTAAARPELARPLCANFIRFVAAHGVSVAAGEFGAHMEIDSVNDGPVTIWLDSDGI